MTQNDDLTSAASAMARAVKRLKMSQELGYPAPLLAFFAGKVAQHATGLQALLLEHQGPLDFTVDDTLSQAALQALADGASNGDTPDTIPDDWTQ